MICKGIHYNWRPVSEHVNDDGCDFETYQVGVNGVIKITNMTPAEDYSGPEFYDVDFEDGRTNTVYNVNQAFFVLKQKKEK